MPCGGADFIYMKSSREHSPNGSVSGKVETRDERKEIESLVGASAVLWPQRKLA